jgi:hypothetical protein
MDTIARNTLPFTLDTLPAFPVSSPAESQVDAIYRYLRDLADARLISPVERLLLPGITELAAVFRCTNLALYDALKALQSNGYEYQFTSAAGPLLLWRKPEPNASSQFNLRRTP